MADKDLGDVLGQTTLTLPVREASARKKVENIQEDTTPVEHIDPIPKAAPPKLKEKGTSAGDIYKSDIQASVNALEAGRKAQLKLDSEKAVDEAERLAAKAYQLSKSSAQQRKEIEEDPARKEYKEALSEKAKPFIPHEENANDLMMLFGLLNVVGFAIGSGGKEYAQAAMSAMNGMLEGHQKGREDLYKKEKSIFETNQKQLDSRIKQLLAFMQDNELLSNMDKTARDQAIESEFLQTGATFMLNYYRQKGLQPTIELLEQAVKTSSEVSKLTRAEVVRAEDQAREDVQKADERKFRLDVASQQANEARARAREDRLFQISVKEQELAAAEDRDRRNKTFESEMAVAKNKVDLAMQKENHRHAEAQSDRVINHAQAIEVERILAQKARDSQYAADRAQDKTEQAARDRATEAFRAEEQKARNTAERLRLEHQKADDAHKARMEGFEKERIELDRRRVAVAEATARGATGEMPKDTKTRDEHRFRHGAIDSLKSVLDDLKDPEIAKLIGPQNQYLPDVILNLQDKYPVLAQKLARFQSEEFKTGGKSLTVSEQKIMGPIYNWRGLTAKALKDNLTEAVREMQYQQGVLEEGYPGLKGMTTRYSSVSGAGAGGTTNSRANLPRANPGEQIHEDAQGNRAVKRGNAWVEVQ